MNVVKVILLGDSGVGKSSLLAQLADQTFRTQHTSTLGIDFRVREFEHVGRKTKMQIFDTSGQERFRSIVAAYFRDADVVIVVFDLGSRASLAHAAGWRLEAMRAALKTQLYILVGNKSDLENHAVTAEQGAAFALEHGFNMYLQTTATTQATQDTFQAIADKVNSTSCFAHQPPQKVQVVQKPECCVVM